MTKAEAQEERNRIILAGGMAEMVYDREKKTWTVSVSKTPPSK